MDEYDTAIRLITRQYHPYQAWTDLPLWALYSYIGLAAGRNAHRIHAFAPLIIAGSLSVAETGLADVTFWLKDHGPKWLKGAAKYLSDLEAEHDESGRSTGRRIRMPGLAWQRQIVNLGFAIPFAHAFALGTGIRAFATASLPEVSIFTRALQAAPPLLGLTAAVYNYRNFRTESGALDRLLGLLLEKPF